jgi:hypothetical protein
VSAIGAGLIALPFVVVTVVGVKTVGWKAMAAIWGLTVALLGLIGAGVYLIQG